MRIDSRKNNELRKVKIIPNYSKYADGSVLISSGNTKVICNATIEDRLPPHLRNAETGWITAEYSMLPRAGIWRTPRKRIMSSGRTQEISRLIGRSFRSSIDLALLGPRTITIDCDVFQADGGTRTASITGGFVALAIAINKLIKNKTIKKNPIKEHIAAISLGIVENKCLLDLCYEEDVSASVDMNVVMTSKGKYVEIQGTGEESVFSSKDLNSMLNTAKIGIDELIKVQKKVLKWK